MKKRILSLVLVFSILSTLIVALPITANAETSGTCGDNLTWTLDDNGTLTISGTGDMTNYDNFSHMAPWYSERENITRLKISDNVTSIGNSAFQACRLTHVTIPGSVTSIGQSAFSRCRSLTDVYYTGSETQWGQIIIRDNNECLTDATIHLYKAPEKLYGRFSYASGAKSADFTYNDTYFSGNADKYNDSLGRISIRLALAAFAKHDSKNKYENQYANVKSLLNKLHFRDFDKNDCYTEKPTTNSIGVAVARKWVKYSDGDYTVLAVAIRGGNYENEWGGNFNVGTGELHEGFRLARDQVLEFLKDYVKKYNVTGNVKIWITGYSRGGATANLTAGYIDENLNMFGDNVNLSAEDLYAYCFEPPAGVKNPDNASGKYNNIFNIANQHDFVPMVVMNKWGYGRYGITKYLPSAQINDNYKEMSATMKQKWENYSGKSHYDYLIDDFASYELYIKTGYDWLLDYSIGVRKTETNYYAYAQGRFIEKNLMDNLADKAQSPSVYTEKYQDDLISIGEKIIGGNKGKAFAKKLGDSFKNAKSLYLTVPGLILGSPITKFASGYSAIEKAKKIIKETCAEFDVILSDETITLFAKVLLNMSVVDLTTLFNNLEGIAQSHTPELCMAWLDTIDDSIMSNTRLRTLYLNCPVDMEVYDSNGTKVAAIHNNVVEELDSDIAIACFIDENGQKSVYLPSNVEYSIKVIATDDGNVTYSIQESDIGKEEVDVTVYNSISVKKGDVLVGTAENLDNVENAVYTLTKDDVPLEASQVIENAEPLSVNVSVEGNGSTTGGGTFYYGEFAEVSAKPTDDEKFLGWYNGETLVSEDMQYRFAVTETVELTAKFTSNTCEVMFVDEENDLISSQRILKGCTVTFPKISEKPLYKFDGFYIDGTIEIDETKTFAEDTTVYVKYLKADCFDGIYYFPIEDNTAEVVGTEIADAELIIPTNLNGYTVTKIAESAFKNSEITKAVIPDTITEIGNKAFYNCKKLAEINVDENNEKYYSEYGVLFTKDKTILLQYPSSKSDKSYILPEGVKTISQEAFSGCMLHTIVLPVSLKTVESWAFEKCSDLDNVLYSGTEEQYSEIDFTSNNDALQNLDIIFNYMETPAKIESVYCKYDDNKLNAEVIFDYVMEAGTLFLGVYDDKKLVTIKSPISIDELGATFEFDADESYKGYKVKSFYWKDSSLEPLAKAVGAEIE